MFTSWYEYEPSFCQFSLLKCLQVNIVNLPASDFRPLINKLVIEDWQEF